MNKKKRIEKLNRKFDYIVAQIRDLQNNCFDIIEQNCDTASIDIDNIFFECIEGLREYGVIKQLAEMKYSDEEQLVGTKIAKKCHSLLFCIFGMRWKKILIRSIEELDD